MGVGSAASALPSSRSRPVGAQSQPPSLQFGLVDVTKAAGIAFTHQNGAFGKKYLPETLGAGVAFLDFDSDGDQDILVRQRDDVAGAAASRSASYSRLLQERRQRQIHGRDALAAGLDVEHVRDGRRGRPTSTTTARPICCSRRSVRIVCSATPAAARSPTSPRRPGSAARAGLQHVGHVVRLRQGRPPRSAGLQLRPVDAGGRRLLQRGRQDARPTARRRRIAARTSLAVPQSRATARSRTSPPRRGFFDATSKSLGVDAARLRPGRLARRLHRQRHAAEQALSQQRQRHVHRAGPAGGRCVQRGRARASRHGRRRRRRRQQRQALRRRDELLRRDARAVPAVGGGQYADVRRASDIGRATRHTLGFGCFFFDVDLDGLQDLLVVNGHIDDTISKVQARISYAESPHLFQIKAAAASATSRRAAGRIRASRRSAAARPSATSTATASSTSSSRPTVARPTCIAADRPERKPGDPLRPARVEIEP